MHVVRQDPRMVRSGPDCILGYSARALPRMWELDLDTVSVGRSCDRNTVRGLRAVCCWALTNNMIERSKGLSVSRTLSVVAMPARPSRIWTTRRRNCSTRCGVNQKGGYTLFMKAMAEAIIELARNSATSTARRLKKSVTSPPRSIQRSFRIDCAT
jgi:hypothetical protein